MIQSRCGSGFPFETLHQLISATQIFAEKFYGNLTAQLDIFAFKNNTHAAAAEFFEYPKVRDGPTRHIGVYRLPAV